MFNNSQIGEIELMYKYNWTIPRVRSGGVQNWKYIGNICSKL